jgi:ectoine hydroxylase-related dioxygenase (phytanoyl-CoA dioxygenase family)
VTAADVDRFWRDGFFFPIPALTTAEANRYRSDLAAAEALHGDAVDPFLRSKPHLVFTWASELVHHPGILDAVELVLGPDILCWGSSFFNKAPRDHAYVSWHQDAAYWGLDPPDVVTAWIALSDVSRCSGPLRFVPGSHRLAQLAHHDTDDRDNLLSQGQVADLAIDPGSVVEAPLGAGEMSLHHVRLVHGSGPNESDQRRIGLAIRYLAPHVRQLHGRDFATIARGEDRYGHFVAEPRPRANLDAAGRAAHAASRSAKKERRRPMSA